MEYKERQLVTPELCKSGHEDEMFHQMVFKLLTRLPKEKLKEMFNFIKYDPEEEKYRIIIEDSKDQSAFACMLRDLKEKRMVLLEITFDNVIEDMSNEAVHQLAHVRLHRALDELFADYVYHNPDQPTYTEMPLSKLLGWSYQQTIKPTS